MNQRNDNIQEIYENQINQCLPINASEKINQSPGGHPPKPPEKTNLFLPSSLLKDLDTSEEQEESEEEHDVVYPDPLTESEGINSKNTNYPSWEKNLSKRKLKSPSKKNKDKFHSHDDIQSIKMFQFQKMKQNQIMMQYQAQQQQQQMLYANQNMQSYQFSNFNHPSQFHQHQPPQFQMHPQIYNGNYMVPPFMGMHQPSLMKGMSGTTDMINANLKPQIGTSEKILNNPKRILSSPGTFLPNPQKKKKDKKKAVSDEFQTLEDLIKETNRDLYSLIITQKGSREVQKLLCKITPADLNLLVDHLSPNLSDLMIDKYANYFCQKLIQNCSPELRIQILKSIQSRFIEISCNSFGTHSLQTLIEIANMPSEHEVLCQCVETGIMALALDAKGTHVLQKFISCSNENLQGNIPETLLVNFDKLINDSHGVCVLIKFVQNSSNKDLKEKLISLISQNALEIIQNPFGNYVVQSLLKETDISPCKEILQVICDNFFSLSMQKFSSNVVEITLGIIDEVRLSSFNNYHRRL